MGAITSERPALSAMIEERDNLMRANDISAGDAMKIITNKNPHLIKMAQNEANRLAQERRNQRR